MRFHHRRRKDEGELVPKEGGFFATPPANPPANNALQFNALSESKGELGDFSSTLHVEADINDRDSEYSDIRPARGGTCIQTPPEQAESTTKYIELGETLTGGVLPPTPPAIADDSLSVIEDLPGDIVAGLRLLRCQPAPIITLPGIWGEIVNDAIRIAADGSARRALNLGWDGDDIFGVGLRSSHEFEGLAVWLAGREIKVIDEWTAITTCGAIFFREAFGRPSSPRLPSGPLWRFGRGAQNIRRGVDTRRSSRANPTNLPQTTGAST